MTYPPGSPGYPPAQQPTTQFSAPTQQFGKVAGARPPAAAAGPSKLPVYLLAAVAVLGLPYTCSASARCSTAECGLLQRRTLLDLGVRRRRSLAGLIAGVGLLPKQKAPPALVAVLSVLALPAGDRRSCSPRRRVSASTGALYLIIAFSVLQAIVAVAVLLFDAGVIAPPAPQPKYEQRSSTASTAAPDQYYGQHAQHQGRRHAAAPAASGLSVAVRRRLLGWSAVRRVTRRSASRAARRRRRPVSRPTASRRAVAAPRRPTRRSPAQPQSVASSSKQSGTSPS